MPHSPDAPPPEDDSDRRYQRQIVLPEIGREGQRRLREGKALLVGAGGLGSSAALYLAAAGVGTLGIMDGDVVDLGNLQRQIIHGGGALGAPKAFSARDRLRDLNPLVRVHALDRPLAPDDADDIVAGYDVVLGCVDNFTARLLINEVCVRRNKANVFGSAARFEGQASVFSHAGGPCYRCFFRDPPPDADETRPEDKGVLGTAPGIIGCIQANEAIKILLGAGHTLSGRLLLFDAWRLRFRELAVKRDADCPVCGKRNRR